MDEPTSSLDQKMSAQIIKNIKEISKKNPVLMITHKKEHIKFSNTAYKISQRKVTKIK